MLYNPASESLSLLRATTLFLRALAFPRTNYRIQNIHLLFYALPARHHNHLLTWTLPILPSLQPSTSRSGRSLFPSTLKKKNHLAQFDHLKFFLALLLLFGPC